MTRIVVVGLGPGGEDMVTTGTLAALASAGAVFARTRRHPAASILSGATFFDDVYETADTMAEVYETIVDRLVDAARGLASDAGPVVYAVPGSPLVAEHTVQLLLNDDRIDITVVPALSFLDLTWVRLGIDPVEECVKLVDGHRFAIDAAGQVGPLLVGQCDSAMILSDIKLSIEDWPEEPITVIQRLGLPDELITNVAWADLDRAIQPDHLTSLYIPTLGEAVGAELMRFDELVHALRSGCPWDREQTHESLKRFLLEETYELLEAIDQLDPISGNGIDELCEELGDVLFQVFFHATIAAESGWFTLADVATTVHDKLKARHPHVFGAASFESMEELSTHWEAQKRIEKSRDSIMDGIPAALPSLLYALKVQKKASSAGYSEPSRNTLDVGATATAPDAEVLGDRLFELVEIARTAGVDPEDALRRAALRFRERFEVHSAAGADFATEAE